MQHVAVRPVILRTCHGIYVFRVRYMSWGGCCIPSDVWGALGGRPIEPPPVSAGRQAVYMEPEENTANKIRAERFIAR